MNYSEFEVEGFRQYEEELRIDPRRKKNRLKMETEPFSAFIQNERDHQKATGTIRASGVGYEELVWWRAEPPGRKDHRRQE